MLRRLLVVLGTMIGVASCAPKGSPDAGPYSRISYEEIIQNAGMPNMFELIQTIRPNFLIERAVSVMDTAAAQGEAQGGGPPPQAEPTGYDPTVVAPPGRITVFLDGGKFGLVQSLRVIDVNAVRSVKYIRQFDAETQYGTRGPVIALYSR